MALPIIRWKNPYLLIGVIYDDIVPAYKGEEHKLAPKFALATIERYATVWKPYEEKILSAMCELTGLQFRQNVIDVYVAPFHHSFSDPMILATKYESDRVVEVLTHELLHRLLTDNTTSEYTDNFINIWREMFGAEHSDITLLHIPVHAALQAIFEDYLDESPRVVRDKQMCASHPDYDAAWNYVKKIGYRKIVKQLRDKAPSTKA